MWSGSGGFSIWLCCVAGFGAASLCLGGGVGDIQKFVRLGKMHSKKHSTTSQSMVAISTNGTNTIASLPSLTLCNLNVYTGPSFLLSSHYFESRSAAISVHSKSFPPFQTVSATLPTCFVAASSQNPATVIVIC